MPKANDGNGASCATLIRRQGGCPGKLFCPGSFYFPGSLFLVKNITSRLLCISLNFYLYKFKSTRKIETKCLKSNSAYMINLVHMSGFLCFQGSVQFRARSSPIFSEFPTSHGQYRRRAKQANKFGGPGVLPREFVVTTPSRLA